MSNLKEGSRTIKVEKSTSTQHLQSNLKVKKRCKCKRIVCEKSSRNALNRKINRKRSSFQETDVDTAQFSLKECCFCQNRENSHREIQTKQSSLGQNKRLLIMIVLCLLGVYLKYQSWWDIIIFCFFGSSSLSYLFQIITYTVFLARLIFMHLFTADDTVWEYWEKCGFFGEFCFF